MTAAMTQNDPSQLVEREVVYIGRRVIDGRSLYAWTYLQAAPIAGEDGLGQAWVFQRQIADAHVGDVFRVYEKPDGSGVQGRYGMIRAGRYSPKFLRRYGEEVGEDRDLILRWTGQDEETVVASKGAELPIQPLDPLERVLAPLRAVSRQLNERQRREFLDRVIAAIVDPG